MESRISLNPRQLEAVLHPQGPLLVLAGPGSGKTRVLTRRIAHLIQERHIDPFSVLAITFTNKAAEEMRFRVQDLLGPDIRGMWIGTFHATCARILRQHIERLGFQTNFVIYDDGDQLRMIRACLKKRHLDEKEVRPARVQSLLDRAKNQATDPRTLEAVLPPAKRELLQGVLTDYASSMKEANALDFGDLILFVVQLLDRHPDLLDFYQRRFRFVLVDEYQDTNRAQHLLLKKLVSPGGNLCVVGDDDQSIYRWRGAEVENMLFFEKDFPGSRVITLEQNYRSTGNILHAAMAVARGNPDRLDKQLWTANGSGDPIICCEKPTSDEEAEFVAREIRSLVASGPLSYRDVGVFYRTNAQSRAFEERFPAHGIPYSVIGSLRFYERSEIKDLMAYLRLLYNPADSVSLLRILNRPPRGIGAVTQNRLESRAGETGQSVWDALGQDLQSGFWKGSAHKKLDDFRKTILALSDSLNREIGLADFLELLLRATRYRDFLDGLPDGERRRDYVDELIDTADNFEKTIEGESGLQRLGAFCERIALVTGADTSEGRGNGVSLMTLHCAKGLEFSIVFLTGMEDGLLPHQRSTLSVEGIAEERRLCYVGMTRAKSKLYLSRARTRRVYGETRLSLPSPFLLSIPEELCSNMAQPEGLPPPFFRDRSGSSEREIENDDDLAPSAFPSLSPITDPKRDTSFRVGDRLVHDSLGQGTVRKVESAGGREKIIVEFSNRTIRKLMAQHAPIRKISS
jgi:DNA helicase II / ATP-dependent DNA helicase PcrA